MFYKNLQRLVDITQYNSLPKFYNLLLQFSLLILLQILIELTDNIHVGIAFQILAKLNFQLDIVHV